MVGKRAAPLRYLRRAAIGSGTPWLHLVKATVNHLLAHGRRDDGFYIRCFTADGDMLDNRADLYDQAFIMFCFDPGKRRGGWNSSTRPMHLRRQVAS